MQDLKNLLPEVPQVNRFLYDWLSLSFKGMTPSEMIEFLGLTDSRWEILTSGNGYTHRHFFNQISISFCEDMSPSKCSCSRYYVFMPVEYPLYTLICKFEGILMDILLKFDFTFSINGTSS